MQAIPAAAMYSLFAGGVVAATFPIWRLWLFGFNPTLDEVLLLPCFGF